MKYLIALIVAASFPVFGAESTNAPVKAELDIVPEAQPAVSTQIVQRLRREGDGWLLNEQDREKLSITLTNQQGKVCAGPVVSKVAPYGLLLAHESGAFWCGWPELPPETREKYQAIAAQAKKNSGPRTFDGETTAPVVPASASVPADKSSPSTVNQSSSPTSADQSDKTVHVKGYYRKDGTYVAPYNRRPPRKK